MEEELKSKTELLDSLSDSIFLHDFEGNFLYVNKAAYKLLGYTKSELMSMNLHDLDVPEYEKLIKYRINDLKEKEDVIFESGQFHKDGSIIPLEVHARVIEMNGQKFVLSVARDITERKKAEKENIRVSTLSSIIDGIPDALIVTNIEGKIILFNKTLTKNYGFSEEILGELPTILVAPEDKDLVLRMGRECLREGFFTNVEATHITADERRIPALVSAVLLKDEKGEPLNILIIVRDISKRKKVEEELKIANSYNRSLIEASLDPMVTIGPDGKITDFNTATEHVTGYSREELLGTDFSEYFTDSQKAKEIYNEVFYKGYVKDYPLEIKNENGSITPVIYNASLYHDQKGKTLAVFAAARDITQLKNVEDQLKKSLKEKEMLLKEIHHRVKNNLTVISSLLNLQADYIKDKNDRALFQESQNRAKSMAIIHERLYQSSDLKSLEFGNYIRTLVNELSRNYALDPEKIKTNLDVEDIQIDINLAIPLGLILNELVSNSMKHAFPDNRDGEINIEFYKDSGKLVLMLEDNGVGFPADLDYKNTDSLGMQLVNSLTDQIKAKMELKVDNGTKFKIIFKEK